MTVAGRDLSGRAAVVTGAARGIGFGIARALLAGGASVVINDISAEGAEAAAEALAPDAIGDAAVVWSAGDVADEAYAAELPLMAERAIGGADILVNNAGLAISRLARDLDRDAWHRTLEVNLTAPFLTSVAVGEWLRERGRTGRIVNVSSIAGRRISVHGSVAYTASKAGLLGLTRHLAFEYAPYGITVNAVCPGAVASPRFQELAGTRGVEKRLAQVPLGRFLEPAEVAWLVAFLASDAAAGITGTAVDVDGGSSLGWEPVTDYEAWMAAATTTREVES